MRRIRAKISREHGHDLKKMFEHLRDIEANSEAKVVHKRGKRSSA